MCSRRCCHSFIYLLQLLVSTIEISFFWFNTLFIFVLVGFAYIFIVYFTSVVVIISPFLFYKATFHWDIWLPCYVRWVLWLLQGKGIGCNNVMALWGYQFNLDHLQLFEEGKTRDRKFAFPQLATVMIQYHVTFHLKLNS